MITRKDITEKLIVKAGLSKEEAKVIRVRYGLPTAGKRSKRWVESLSFRKHKELLISGIEKIGQTINGAGN